MNAPIQFPIYTRSPLGSFYTKHISENHCIDVYPNKEIGINEEKHEKTSTSTYDMLCKGAAKKITRVEFETIYNTVSDSIRKRAIDSDAPIMDLELENASKQTGEFTC